MIGLVIWMNIKSNHQKDFFDAICNDIRFSLEIIYFNEISDDRINEGWSKLELKYYEKQANSNISILNEITDWTNKVHIIGGYRSFFHTQLIFRLCRNKVKWYFWAEPSFPGLRYWLTYPLKFSFSLVINRYAAGALAISENAKSDFKRKGIKPSLIYWLPYSINIPNNGLVRKNLEVCHFIHVGKMCHRKGTDIIIEALRLLSIGKFDFEFTFIGQIDDSYLKLISDYGLDNYVKILGRVDSNSVFDIIGNHDVFVFPSRFDGWGVALVEALYKGLAIISTRTTGAAIHAISGNGFLLKNNTATELAKSMEHYIREPSLLNQHKRKSLVLSKIFTPMVNVERLFGILSNN